jgi:NADP-dependent 3-hydroxy acid dehydrogenase YdfG
MKTILITGATSGIGRATARLLAQHQFALVLCGRRKDRLDALQHELSAFTHVHTLCFDVRDNAAVVEAGYELVK